MITELRVALLNILQHHSSTGCMCQRAAQPIIWCLACVLSAFLLLLWLLLWFSLRFNDHFPGEPGLADVYWSKGWWRWWCQVDYRSYKSCKAPGKSSPPTNQHPVFYRPDALPVTQPTVSKHWREKYHIPWTCLPQAHLGIFQLCLWQNSSWLPWGRVAMPLVSPLMPVPLLLLWLLEILPGKNLTQRFFQTDCFQLFVKLD